MKDVKLKWDKIENLTTTMHYANHGHLEVQLIDLTCRPRVNSALPLNERTYEVAILNILTGKWLGGVSKNIMGLADAKAAGVAMLALVLSEQHRVTVSLSAFELEHIYYSVKSVYDELSDDLGSVDIEGDDLTELMRLKGLMHKIGGLAKDAGLDIE